MSIKIGQWSIGLVSGSFLTGEFELRAMGKIGGLNVQIAFQTQKENEHNVIDLQVETWEEGSHEKKSTS